MYKTVLLIIIGAMLIGAISAEETAARNHFSFGAVGGILYGQAEEIVYLNSSSSNYMSQLLWDMKPLVFMGAALEYVRQKPLVNFDFFIDASIKWGIPGLNAGIMEDRDWLGTNPAWLTHYSTHDNRTTDAMLVEANMGVIFTITENIMLKTALSYRFMSFAWTASGGSVLYPATEDNPSTSHGYLQPDLDVISYQQEWHIVAPMISLYGQFNRFFNTEIAIKASPAIFFAGEDDHILRSLIFTSSYSNGLFIEPSLIFSWMLSDYFSLSLSAAYRHISGSRGDVRTTKNGIDLGMTRNTEGAGYAVFDVGLSARAHLSF